MPEFADLPNSPVARLTCSFILCTISAIRSLMCSLVPNSYSRLILGSKEVGKYSGNAGTVLSK